MSARAGARRPEVGARRSARKTGPVARPRSRRGSSRAVGVSQWTYARLPPFSTTWPGGTPGPGPARRVAGPPPRGRTSRRGSARTPVRATGCGRRRTAVPARRGGSPGHDGLDLLAGQVAGGECVAEEVAEPGEGARVGRAGGGHLAETIEEVVDRDDQRHTAPPNSEHLSPAVLPRCGSRSPAPDQRDRPVFGATLVVGRMTRRISARSRALVCSIPVPSRRKAPAGDLMA